MDDDAIVPEPPSMAWLLTFADLVSLLITFFVLLYSMKVTDAQKWEEIKGSFDGVFSVKEPIFDTQPDRSTTVEKIDPLAADNLDYIYNILERDFKKSEFLSKSELEVDRERQILKVVLPSATIFASGNAQMINAGQGTLQELGDMLRHFDNRIEVAGHTDPLPVGSNSPYPTNWELAMMRSIRVAKMLEEQGIMGPIEVVSYGSGQYSKLDYRIPRAERMKMSRRVEIIIHSDQEQNR